MVAAPVARGGIAALAVPPRRHGTVAPLRGSAIGRCKRGLLQPGVGMAGRRSEGQCGLAMTAKPGHPSEPAPEPGPGQGIDGVMLQHRAALLRFLASHATGDEAEDLFHELWLRVTQTPMGPVGNPLAYLYRAANNLAIDRHRSRRQAQAREQAWVEIGGAGGISPEPGAERQLISREELTRMEGVLTALGERAAHVVRRFRLDGVPQRQIATELGVSLSTVESDLRRGYAALAEARRQSDDG